MSTVNKAGSFHDYHPHPKFSISAEYFIQGYNEAAKNAFSGASLIGKRCYSVLYNRDSPCPECILVGLKQQPYVSQLTDHACTEITTAVGEHVYVSGFRRDADGNEGGCYECFHSLPPLLAMYRSARELATNILAATNAETIARIVAEFLSQEDSIVSYRTRLYKSDNPVNPSRLSCVWADALDIKRRPYIPTIGTTVIERTEGHKNCSFLSLDSSTMRVKPGMPISSLSHWRALKPGNLADPPADFS